MRPSAPTGTSNTGTPGSPPWITTPPRKNPSGSNTAAAVNARDARRRRRPDSNVRGRHRKGHVEQTEERPMRVRERPHEPSRLVADVEIHSRLQSVETFEHEAAHREDEDPHPPELQVKPGELRRLVFQDKTSVATRRR